MTSDDTYIRWFRFFVGLAVMLGVAFILASGLTPPGVLGEGIRHNRESFIDATPLFYSEVENMSDLEDALSSKYAASLESAGTTRSKD